MNIEVTQIPTRMSSQGTNTDEPTKIKKQRRVALRHSNFLITINSNKSVNKMDSSKAEEEVKKFEAAMVKLFSPAEMTNMLILKPTKTEGEMKDVPLIDRILKAKLEFVVEIGTDKGFIHSHGLFSTSHRALNLKINIDKLRNEFLPNELGYYCYVDVKVFNDSLGNLQEYVRKTADPNRF